MTKSCPDCGSEVEFTAHPAQVLRAACADCGHTFTILQGTGESGEAPAPTPFEGDLGGVAAGTPGPGPAGGPVGPPCPSCGDPLALAAVGRNISGSCASCEETFLFRLATPRDSEAPEMRRGAPSEGGPMRSAGPRARPCRECGAPLRFSTGPDGAISGECDACGNKFTLPPKREGFRGGSRGPPFRNRGYSTSFRGRRDPAFRRGPGAARRPDERRRFRRRSDENEEQ